MDKYCIVPAMRHETRLAALLRSREEVLVDVPGLVKSAVRSTSPVLKMLFYLKDIGSAP